MPGLPTKRKCRVCKKIKRISEFSLRGGRKPNTKCKQCVREYSKQHYKANTKAHNMRRLRNQRIYRKRNQEIMRAAKSGPCCDCRKCYPYYVMQFDHLGEKLFTIGTEVARVTLEKLVSEMAKCDVVCANCHAIRTFKRREEKLIGT